MRRYRQVGKKAPKTAEGRVETCWRLPLRGLQCERHGPKGVPQHLADGAVQRAWQIVAVSLQRWHWLMESGTMEDMS
eukprot:4731499-Pleurochrysis_carterae.AAC.1